MRRLVVLLLATFSLASLPAMRGTASNLNQVPADEETLKTAKLGVDSSALLSFFRARTLNDDDRARIEVLIIQMGAMSFRTREQATQALIDKGPVVVEMLSKHLEDPDPEIARRAENCIKKIKENDYPPEVPPAAVRLLAERKPAGAVAALLAYLPFADNEVAADEVRTALAKLATDGGKVDKALLAALLDKEAVRRAAAGEALTRADVAQARDEVAALLKDANPNVRWRVATALVLAKKREAVPVLIDTLVDASQGQAWQIEDILYRIAEGKSPPLLSLGADPAARKKYRDAWSAWWNEHGKAIDLAVLGQAPKLLGYTTVVLLDQLRVLELDANNAVRWQIDNVNFPLDIQVLAGDKVLIAEYKGGRVTERNFKGEVLWQREFGGAQGDGPQVAQRLPNGNTFIAGKYQWLEVDPAGKQVAIFNVPGVDGIMKCSKVSSGEVVLLYEGGRVVRMDATGKELGAFQINDLSMRLFGGRIQGLPNGRVLIPHHAENKVVEYDSDGKIVWQVKVDQPITATRLPNGNTLVTSMNRFCAVEFDREGKEVWQYRSGSRDVRVTRALRR
jgi:HEAT repeat protein